MMTLKNAMIYRETSNFTNPIFNIIIKNEIITVDAGFYCLQDKETYKFAWGKNVTVSMFL